MNDNISENEDLDDEFGHDLEEPDQLNEEEEDDDEDDDDELNEEDDDDDDDDVDDVADVEADLDDDEDDDDDDDDVDDDDVEADLDAILKERIAAGDDQADDDEEETPATRSATGASGEAEPVIARGDNEFSCPHCFLLVNSAAVVDDECPHCGGPVGAT